MAGPSILKLSRAQLQALVRAASQDSDRVYFTTHALRRMKERRLTRQLVLDVLQSGRLIRLPEFNAAKGSLECRMERFVVGLDIAVVIALSDDDPNLLVITVMTTGN